MAAYDIGEAFQRIEEEMIASMTRNLHRHLHTEKKEGMNYAMWQAEQLAALHTYRNDNKKKFQQYFSTINDRIAEILEKANESGKAEQEIAVLEAIKKGYKIHDHRASGSVSARFFKINKRKMDALIKSAKKDMIKAETAMLRHADDEYRKIIFNSEVFYNSGAGTLPQCVDMATKDFLSAGIACIEYANGARVGIDSYSRMALRTAQTRAYLIGEASKRDEWGVNTVIVNRRGAACPKCLKWVGKVYYDDVWGNSKIPNPPKYPRLSDAIAGGLYHPNCKDIHTTYFEGISAAPKPLTEKEVEEANRVYALEQQQRYNERQIRKYKRLWNGSADPENVQKYKKKLVHWQDTQKEFVKENGDVLKRRLELERVFELPDGFGGFKKTNLKATENSDLLLDKSPKRDKIGVKKFKKFHDGSEVNEFFYYDDEKRGVLYKKNSTYGKWLKELSDDERECVLDYTAGGYGDINDYFRKRGSWKEINAELINEKAEHIDSAIERFELKDNIVVQRGVMEDALDEVIDKFNITDNSEFVGKIFHDEGYVSTTALIGNPVATKKPVLFEISIPSGTGRGAYVNELSGYTDAEYEFLLKRGADYTITGIEENSETSQLIIKMVMNDG